MSSLNYIPKRLIYLIKKLTIYKMSYEAALNKAWEELAKLNPAKGLSAKFLSDEYRIDLESRKVVSLSCNIPAKDYTAILILHYLAHRLKGLTGLSGEWVSFRDLESGEFYYPAFKTRAIDPLVRKYGAHPQGLLDVLKHLPGHKAEEGDIGISLEIFPGVPALITLWRGDEEFGPEANILFDKSISKVFSTEDIAVLAGFIAAKV